VWFVYRVCHWSWSQMSRSPGLSPVPGLTAFMHEEASRRFEHGGKTSIRVELDADNKAIIIFGQDESVFHQFLLRTRQWVGPKGERPFLPKSDGAGVMVSAFLSRDFGFGLKISQQQLEEINFS
jgi:hypothetical protein